MNLKKRSLFLAALALGLAPLAASAQTTGYLYYAAGGVLSGQELADDGPRNSDGMIRSVLVANVSIDGNTVNVYNWRYAASQTLGNLLPADNPATGTTEDFSYLYLENNVFIHDNVLYVGPGDWNGDSSKTTMNTVAYATIDTATGQLGAWSFAPVFPSPADQAIGGGAYINLGGGNAYYYVVGGNSPSTDRVLVSKLQPGGGLGAWGTTTPIPAADWFNRAIAVDNLIVITDGNTTSGGSSSHYTTVNPANGQLGAWNSIGAWAAANRWAQAMATVTSPDNSKFVVVAGGNGPTAEVFTSKVTAGVPGAWTATAPLPVGRRQHTAVGIGKHIFVLGGSATGSVATAINTIQVGAIDNAGAITWTTSTDTNTIAPLPQARNFGGAAFVPVNFPVQTEAKSWTQYE
jgi:hypothetical protein